MRSSLPLSKGGGTTSSVQGHNPLSASAKHTDGKRPFWFWKGIDHPSQNIARAIQAELPVVEECGDTGEHHEIDHIRANAGVLAHSEALVHPSWYLFDIRRA